MTLTLLSLADVVAFLSRPETPLRIDTLVTSMRDKAPCAFCGALTLASYRFGDGLLPADVNCRFAFQRQVDPSCMGNPVLTSRVIRVLTEGQA